MAAIEINGVENLIEELSKRTMVRPGKFRVPTGRLAPSITRETSYKVEHRTMQKPIPPGEMVIDAEYTVNDESASP